MRKVIFTLVLMVAYCSLNATVWRVNNLAGSSAPFSTIQQAHNSALVQPGDTIHLEPSATSYGDLITSKKLIIIGPGIFTSENPQTQANISPSIITDITFNNGSQGTKIVGCQIRHVVINTSEIILLGNHIISSEYNNKLISFGASNINNIIIRNNYLENNNDYTASSGTNRQAFCIFAITDGINNVIIENNYIYVYLPTYIITYKNALHLGSGFSGVIKNNVIHGHNTITNAIFDNNILRNGTFEAVYNVSINHNIGNSTQFGSAEGNQSNVNMANVFLNTGSTDGQWQLRPGSPAIGAGVNGTDCGMFGGAQPWKLSGIPSIPAVYKLEMNVDNANQILEVEMSVKSHN